MPRHASHLSNYALRQRSKALDFGMVEVFEFPIVVGDNPNVSEGCPIALGWESLSHQVLPIDDYENLRGRKSSSSRAKMKLSVSDRAEL
jgi:hypothetical protein